MFELILETGRKEGREKSEEEEGERKRRRGGGGGWRSAFDPSFFPGDRRAST